MIESILKNIKIKEVDEGILSCIGQKNSQSDYDKKVKLYDLVVGNADYNRVVWGNWPSNYAHFCHQALTNYSNGIFLDAGCGSLVFTAKTYAKADKLIVLLDRSIGMLQKGRDRIKKLCHGIPKNIVFVQGDIFDLPFKNAVFDSIATFGVLHIFEEKLALLTELERVKKQSGQIFFSSLVGNNAIGRRYLQILKKGRRGCRLPLKSIANRPTCARTIQIQTNHHWKYGVW